MSINPSFENIPETELPPQPESVGDIEIGTEKDTTASAFNPENWRVVEIENGTTDLELLYTKIPALLREYSFAVRNDRNSAEGDQPKRPFMPAVGGTDIMFKNLLAAAIDEEFHNTQQESANDVHFNKQGLDEAIYTLKMLGDGNESSKIVTQIREIVHGLPKNYFSGSLTRRLLVSDVNTAVDKLKDLPPDPNAIENAVTNILVPKMDPAYWRNIGKGETTDWDAEKRDREPQKKPYWMDIGKQPSN